MTTTELDAMPYGQMLEDHDHEPWQRISTSGPAVWLSLDGYGTRNSQHLLTAFGVSAVLDVRDVVVDAPPVQRMPAVEVSVP